MAFCTQCGRPIDEGEICRHCHPESENKFNVNVNVNIDKESTLNFIEKVKNQIGIGDPELNKGDAYEKDKFIIPDCVKSNESEIPVKQYTIATLRNRILGIPYTKAIGRMQVTNKRVIFRAPGRCLAGRTTLQHEFSIDEVAGIEARREYVFNFWDLIWGLLVCSIGGSIATLITMLIGNDSSAMAFMAALFFGIVGCIPFFAIKKLWLVKLFCLGISLSPMTAVGLDFIDQDIYFRGGILLFLAFIVLIITLFTLFVNAIKPNLVMIVKTKSSSEAIDIKRTNKVLFGLLGEKENHTGYEEIIPAEGAEKSIREIGAMINDIQKLGDFGIEKWKN